MINGFVKAPNFQQFFSQWTTRKVCKVVVCSTKSKGGYVCGYSFGLNVIVTLTAFCFFDIGHL